MSRSAATLKTKTATKSVPMKPPSKNPNGGQPTKFTAQTRQKLLQAIALGMWTEVSIADYAGISYRALRYYLTRAERIIEQAREAAGIDDDGEGEVDLTGLPSLDRDFVQFFHDYTGAKAQREALSLGTIQAATEKNWQAHAWLLERRRPDVYQVKQRHEFSGPGGGPIQMAAITPDDRQRRLERLRAKMAAK